MKKQISNILIMLIILGSYGCEKNKPEQLFTGTWTIIGTGCGIAGQGTDVNFSTLRLIQNGGFEFQRNDTLIEKGTYEISINNNSQYKNLGDYLIAFNSKYKIGNGASIQTQDSKILHELSTDTIVFYETFVDGFCYYFKRLDN